MIELYPLKVTGIVMAVLATVVNMTTEGFYAWKIYEIDQQCSDFQNESDVCMFEELEVRSYVGLAEGIVGTVVSVCFIIGFVVVNLPLIWIWVCWGMGITGYNAYCIYDYYTALDDYMGGFDWDTYIDEPYAYFFIAAITSVSCYTFILLVVIPVAALITNMYMKGNVASFDVGRDYVWDNDAFEMD